MSLTIQAKAGLKAGRSSSRTGSIMSHFTCQVSLRRLGHESFKGGSYRAMMDTFSFPIVIGCDGCDPCLLSGAEPGVWMRNMPHVVNLWRALLRLWPVSKEVIISTGDSVSGCIIRFMESNPNRRVRSYLYITSDISSHCIVSKSQITLSCGRTFTLSFLTFRVTCIILYI